uniref:myozenin-2-like n=1 Tax=Oncorhynchus gorbuscha TaxID=8017 RepID=UPI001EAEB717|nr:myozenin-2-like [Oncorhynchus gorbuscha]
MMQSVYDDLSKQSIQQAKALCTEARGGGMNLGKKISVPKDVMMEELNLPSNRGSRMFQERLRRVERFTLENQVHDHYSNGLPEPLPPQTIQGPQRGKENQAYLMPGNHSLITTLQKTEAMNGSPNVIAPGYCSPWREALGDSDDLRSSLSTQFPQRATLQPANYRCFNRAAMPFGGAQQKSMRVIPVMEFELLDSQRLPGTTLDRMCKRPNFNSVPRGWGHDYSPESTDL